MGVDVVYVVEGYFVVSIRIGVELQEGKERPVEGKRKGEIQML